MYTGKCGENLGGSHSLPLETKEVTTSVCGLVRKKSKGLSLCSTLSKSKRMEETSTSLRNQLYFTHRHRECRRAFRSGRPAAQCRWDRSQCLYCCTRIRAGRGDQKPISPAACVLMPRHHSRLQHRPQSLLMMRSDFLLRIDYRDF